MDKRDGVEGSRMGTARDGGFFVSRELKLGWGWRREAVPHGRIVPQIYPIYESSLARPSQFL